MRLPPRFPDHNKWTRFWEADQLHGTAIVYTHSSGTG
jgi:hypothetical protein